MKKLDLDKLKVQSFVTSLDSKKNQTIKGGDMDFPTHDCDGDGGGGGNGDYTINCDKETGPSPAHCQSYLHFCHTEKLDPHCSPYF